MIKIFFWVALTCIHLGRMETCGYSLTHTFLQNDIFLCYFCSLPLSFCLLRCSFTRYGVVDAFVAFLGGEDIKALLGQLNHQQSKNVSSYPMQLKIINIGVASVCLQGSIKECLLIHVRLAVKSRRSCCHLELLLI